MKKEISVSASFWARSWNIDVCGDQDARASTSWEERGEDDNRQRDERQGADSQEKMLIEILFVTIEKNKKSRTWTRVRGR